MTEDDTVIQIHDNKIAYTPPCCRPGGRCQTETVRELTAEELEFVEYLRGIES